MTIVLNEHITLELTDIKHAQGLLEAVNNNREHLSRFLPWVNNMQSVADFTQYIERCKTLFQQKLETSFVILFDNKVAGRIGIHYIDQYNKTANIGYWLAAEYVGKGIILQSAKAIIHYGFKELNLHRIEIKAAVNNFKSQAVPQKLGFKKEGVLRQAELVNNIFTDVVLYAVLKNEWEM